MHMIYKCFISFAFIFPLLLPSMAGADIVRYVDKNGVIHFTNRVKLEGQEVYIKTTQKKKPRIYSKKRPYAKEISEAAQKNGLDPKLISSVIQAESDFDPKAVSKAGARGLMQLMPQTASRYKVKNIHNPEENIEGGTKYFKDLMEKYKGDVKLALAAYNAGESAVAKYSGIPPYPETMNYVTKVLDIYSKMPGGKMRFAPTKTIYRYLSKDGIILLTDTPKSLASF